MTRLLFSPLTINSVALPNRIVVTAMVTRAGLETRLRLPSEVLVRVREMVGPDYPVGIRFDGEECIQGGYGLTDSKYRAHRFAQLGADYISISAGGKFEDAIKKEREFQAGALRFAVAARVSARTRSARRSHAASVARRRRAGGGGAE